MHVTRTGKADELAQVAGHEVAQLGEGGDVDEADEELPLQPVLREHQPLRMRPHKLLHRLWCGSKQKVQGCEESQTKTTEADGTAHALSCTTKATSACVLASLLSCAEHDLKEPDTGNTSPGGGLAPPCSDAAELGLLAQHQRTPHGGSPLAGWLMLSAPGPVQDMQKG